MKIWDMRFQNIYKKMYFKNLKPSEPKLLNTLRSLPGKLTKILFKWFHGFFDALCLIVDSANNAHCLFSLNCFWRHRLTRHQYYLQLRRDVLEDRVYCTEETALFLAALALQAEFGDYLPEVSEILMNIWTLNRSN